MVLVLELILLLDRQDIRARAPTHTQTRAYARPILYLLTAMAHFLCTRVYTVFTTVIT